MIATIASERMPIPHAYVPSLSGAAKSVRVIAEAGSHPALARHPPAAVARRVRRRRRGQDGDRLDAAHDVAGQHDVHQLGGQQLRGTLHQLRRPHALRPRRGSAGWQRRQRVQPRPGSAQEFRVLFAGGSNHGET